MSTNPFHLYPQHPDAHEDRPWWRRVPSAFSSMPGRDDFPLWMSSWKRRDGRTAEAIHLLIPDFHDDEIGLYNAVAEEDRPSDEWVMERIPDLFDAIDREHPLPPPPPLVGQVWVYEDSPTAGHLLDHLVVGVKRWADGKSWGVCFHDNWYTFGTRGAVQWPPMGAVLVAGHGAPWAPPGWAPGGER